MSIDNYPLGTRAYDSDPRSPFYEDPSECDECGGELDVDVDCDEDGYYETVSCRVCDAEEQGE